MTRFLCGVLLMSVTFVSGSVPVIIIDRYERRAENEIRGLSIPLQMPHVEVEVEDLQFTKIVESLRDGEFFPWGHACGNGFVTGYLTVGRKKLSHSFAAFKNEVDARESFFRQLASAKTIISEPSEVIREGKRVTRVFLKGESDEKEFFQIMWIERHPNGYTSVVGPDEATTLQLEQYVIRKD